MTTHWTCPHCRQTNPAGMRFCPHCGASQVAPRDAAKPLPPQSNPRKLWIAALSLWLLSCVILAVGAGIWWSKRDNRNETVAAAPPTAITNELNSSPTPTGDLLAAATPTAPPGTTSSAEVDTPAEQSDSQDTVNVSAGQESSGDTLVLPTPPPAPEGIILFLSSRDHEPESEEWTQHRDLELYGMRPDGSQQTRLSDGTRLWGSETVELTNYFISGQVVVNETGIFDLKARRVVEELVPTQVIDGLPLKFTRGSSSKSSPFFALGPVWSQTGEIVFSGGDSSGSFSLYHLGSIHGAVQQLTVAPDKAWGDGFPAWSPDGQQIAFDRQWNDKNQDGIWVISKDGSELRRLVKSEVIANGTRQTAWSPDGKKIAYEGPKKNAEHYLFELWTVDVEGQNPKQLTDQHEDIGIWQPVWSTDGQQIAFAIQDIKTLEQDIYTIDAEGGEPQQLTSEGFYNIYPLWLPLDADEILAGGDTPLQARPTPTPRPQPQPAKSTNCPSSGVQISSPAPGARFTQRNNFVVGTANIPRFHHWRIEYSTDPNGGWNYLLERDYPVDNDKLVMIDASTVPNGPYGLRLTVVDETGNYPEPCEVWFTNAY